MWGSLLAPCLCQAFREGKVFVKRGCIGCKGRRAGHAHSGGLVIMGGPNSSIKLLDQITFGPMSLGNNNINILLYYNIISSTLFHFLILALFFHFSFFTYLIFQNKGEGLPRWGWATIR